MTALLRIRHGAEGLALSPVDAAPDGIAQYARRHKVRRQNLVLFHFQTPEGRKTGIAFVPHAGARTFVKVFPAVGAQPLAKRPGSTSGTVDGVAGASVSMASPKGGNYNTALREAQQMANNGYDMAQITEYLIRKNYSDSTISQVSQTMGW